MMDNEVGLLLGRAGNHDLVSKSSLFLVFEWYSVTGGFRNTMDKEVIAMVFFLCRENLCNTENFVRELRSDLRASLA